MKIMKTIHRKLKYFYCFSALAIYPSLHAGGQTSSFFDREDVQSIGKTIIDMLIDRIPFLGKAVSEYRLEHKVDRLGQGQRTGLDQLRDLAKQAIKTKEKVEEMYYFTQQSIRIADDLRQNLQSGKGQNFLGALVEIWTGISVNPADYIPETPSTKQLKENIAWDLSAESGLVRQYEYFLQGTRAALLAQPGLFDKGPEQFNRAYQEAVRYEQELIKALSAKEQATIILYTAEIEKLQAQIKVLEERQQQEGLTISDRMQIARTIDNKKQIIRALNEKITEGIKKQVQPTTKQEEALEQQQAANDVKIMEDDHNTERARMHKKYGHLWRF